MTRCTPSQTVSVGLFPRRLKKRADTQLFAWNFLELWRIGASGALTWFIIGLGVSWAVSLLMGVEAAESVFDYLFIPVALWFVALGVGAILAKNMTVADLGPEGLGLSWGPIFFKKRLLVPFEAIERVELAHWERQLTPGQPAGRLTQNIEGLSPRIDLREPIEINHLVQLPRLSERYSAKKPLVATDDGRQLWMYRRLKDGYGPFAKALGQYVQVEGVLCEEELKKDAPLTRWERSDWMLSVFLVGELAWIALRLFG